jgi:hypothetical protein
VLLLLLLVLLLLPYTSSKAVCPAGLLGPAIETQNPLSALQHHGY